MLFQQKKLEIKRELQEEKENEVWKGRESDGWGLGDD